MLATRYHLDETHLKYYDEKLKSWASSQPVKTLPSTLYPWTQIEKAGAVTCWPVGSTPLLPTVDFLFTETPPASGDKGPENPSTISGVSEVKVTRCGKNLAELNRVYALSGRGITVSVNANGSIHAEGTVGSTLAVVDIGNHDDSANKQLPYWMEVGKTYTLSFNSSNANGNPRASIYLPNSLTAWGSPHIVYPGESYTFTVDSNRKRGLVRITFGANSTVNCDCYIQIEEGSSATSFDGTIPDVYTLDLNGTFYGGSFDLATGLMTVTWWGVVFTGKEENTWFSQGQTPSGINRYSAVLANKALLKSSLYSQYCTHFPYAGNWDSSSQIFYASNNYINFFSTKPTLEDFKAFVASQYASGTPVIATYMLTNPQTIQLTPTKILSLPQADKYTPRLNTIYTDASAVQVGYVKSPIREEYELTQAIVAQGGNI